MTKLNNKKLVIDSSEKMESFGKKVAKSIALGTVVGLKGDLGTGKTTFAKGFAKGLDIIEHVTSPTFKIVSEYESDTGTLFHIDCYRLSGYTDFIELDAERLLYPDHGITLIEWPEIIEEIIPKDSPFIEFSLGESENQREILVRGVSV